MHGLALYSGGRDRCRSGYAADFGFVLFFPPHRPYFPLLGLRPGPLLGLYPASVPVPTPVSVPAPRWSLSQSSFQPPFPFPRLFPCLPRAGLCSNPGLGPRLCLGPAPLLSLLLFVPFVPASGYPKSLAAVFLLFSWISRYSVLLRFCPASFFFRFVRGGTVVFLNF